MLTGSAAGTIGGQRSRHLVPAERRKDFGAKAINEANRNGSASFEPGSEGRFEILAFGSDRGFGWWTGVQHATARTKGKDVLVPMQLRTTEFFRNEGGA